MLPDETGPRAPLQSHYRYYSNYSDADQISKGQKQRLGGRGPDPREQIKRKLYPNVSATFTSLSFLRRSEVKETFERTRQRRDATPLLKNYGAVDPFVFFFFFFSPQSPIHHTKLNSLSYVQSHLLDASKVEEGLGPDGATSTDVTGAGGLWRAGRPAAGEGGTGGDGGGRRGDGEHRLEGYGLFGVGSKVLSRAAARWPYSSYGPGALGLGATRLFCSKHYSKKRRTATQMMVKACQQHIARNYLTRP